MYTEILLFGVCAYYTRAIHAACTAHRRGTQATFHTTLIIPLRSFCVDFFLALCFQALTKSLSDNFLLNFVLALRNPFCLYFQLYTSIFLPPDRPTPYEVFASESCFTSIVQEEMARAPAAAFFP